MAGANWFRTLRLTLNGVDSDSSPRLVDLGRAGADSTNTARRTRRKSVLQTSPRGGLDCRPRDRGDRIRVDAQTYDIQTVIQHVVKVPARNRRK